MSCDIHLFVEVRRNGKWQREVICPEAFRGEDGREYEWYGDRNYEAFAVLANVRNYSYVTPISEPKGWPDDLSDEGRKLADQEREYDENDVYMGDHSASWLTLAELQSYPWEQRVTQSGVVSLDQFLQRCAKHGMALPVVVDRYPYESWSRSISGRDIVMRDAAEVLAAMAAGDVLVTRSGVFHPTMGERTYVRDEWSTPAASQVGGLTGRLIPALESLGLPPNDVRIVFNFDS